jgi:hypothetical protein
MAAQHNLRAQEAWGPLNELNHRAAQGYLAAVITSTTPILQYSTTPVLQYSNTPPLHRSVAPLLRRFDTFGHS